MDKHADILREARDRFELAWNFDEENRDEALDDLLFSVGQQWPEDIKREREAEGRPMLTINRMLQFIRQVTGDIRQNRPAIKVLPVDSNSDPDLAEVFTGIIRHIENQSDAQAAYFTAADLATACGMGHFRILTEYVDDDVFDLDITIKRIGNPFAVYFDPDAKEITREDARYCFVTDRISLASFKEKYPGKLIADFEGDEPRENMRHWFFGESVRIAEYFYKVPKKRTLAQLSDGRVIDATRIKPDMLQMLGVVRTREAMRDVVMWVKMSGLEVLEGPTEWPGKHIPIVPVFGEEVNVGERVVRHGVIRYAKDAQRMYNYWRSAQTEMVALQPKAPFKVTPTNIQGFEAYWKAANTRNLPYLVYTPDPKNGGIAPQRETPPLASQGMTEEVMLAADDMKATTGIYDAALGQKSNETSGKAILARQRESDISTFAYIDNVARAIRHAGRILIDLIPKVYDTERVVRLMNEDGSVDYAEINKVVLGPEGPVVLNDLSVGRYDVEVTTGPSYTTKRQEAAEAMIAFAQASPQVAALIMDLVAQNQDWPGADEIAKRLRKLLPPGIAEPVEGEEPPPPPAPDPMLRIEMAGKLAETQGKALDNERKKRELLAPMPAEPGQASAF